VSAPTPEQVAERARRADRATRGALAAVLALEAVVTLLLPRALAYTESGLGTSKTVLLISLAVVMLAAAGMQRRPWGIGVGSTLQVLFLLTGLLLVAMLVVAVVFVGIWLRLLWLRKDLVGTPAGWRMLYS
jgi:hypothetical protein